MIFTTMILGVALLCLLRNKLTINMVITYVGLCLAMYYTYWAVKLQFNVNPDELMRYLLPKYIYKHNSLPSGYTKEVIYHLGNWSYAFYPQWLGSILSAVFMKLVAIFSTSSQALLVGARLTSVLFGVIASIFVGLSLKILTNDKLVVAAGMSLIGLLPQFTYLSSYVNNDIIAVAGVAIIFYASLLASKTSWNIKNSILLAIGMIICLLGYMNSYGFVLVGGCYFLFSMVGQVRQETLSNRKASLLFAIIACLVIVCVLPFLIRNYLLYNGDFLGMATFKKEYQSWLANGGQMLQHPYASFSNLLFDSAFWEKTWHSFVGLFGYFTVELKPIYYTYYLLIFFGSGIGLLINKKTNTKFLEPILKWSMIIGSVITFLLFLYYTLMIDSQPQGRYIMSIVPLLMIGVTLGLFELVKGISKHYRLCFALLTLTYILMNGIILICYVKPNLM